MSAGCGQGMGLGLGLGHVCVILNRLTRTIPSFSLPPSPLSLDIEISVIPPADEEDDDYEKLTYDTMNLLAHFDPSNTTKHHVEVATDDDYSYTTQSQLFKSVRKGFEKEGLNIETPKKVRTLSKGYLDC